MDDDLWGFGVFLFLAGCIYFAKILFRPRSRILTNRERAIVALNALRDRMAGTDPYSFGVEVSNDVRSYIHAEHDLSATRQTSIEFLQSIADHALLLTLKRLAWLCCLRGLTCSSMLARRQANPKCSICSKQRCDLFEEKSPRV